MAWLVGIPMPNPVGGSPTMGFYCKNSPQPDTAVSFFTYPYYSYGSRALSWVSYHFLWSMALITAISTLALPGNNIFPPSSSSFLTMDPTAHHQHQFCLCPASKMVKQQAINF